MNDGSPKNSQEKGLRIGRDADADLKSEIPNPQSKTPFPRWLLLVVGWLAMLVFAFHACTHMVAAGDTWVAMACGRHFVNHGVTTVEPFSANSHKAGPTPEEVKTWPSWAQWITKTVGLDTVKKVHPTGWIDQNWLTHVIFYKLTTMLGSEDKPYFDALVYWKFALYFLLVACLYFTSRLLGVNQVLAVVFSCAAMFIGRSFLDVRPAGFSNLMVPTFALILALTSYRNALYIWLLVPLIVFWSNVHGGYIYAFLMLIPFVAWHTIMRMPKRWAIATFSIGTWAVMCLLAHQFPKSLLNHFPDTRMLGITPTSMTGDWVLYVFLVAAAGIAALAWSRQISERALITIGAAISFLLFMIYLTGRLLPKAPLELSEYGQQLFQADVNGATLAFAGISGFAAILGVTAAFAWDRIVRVMEPRAIIHTVAAGIVAFIAMVIFNPFHLTNLTHTFEISVSSHAERWRDVHEWQRAFEWANPVGTAIPFMVIYILSWACVAIWAIVLIRNERLASQVGKRKRPAIRDPRMQKDRVPAPESEYVWPKVDLALIVIAGMTLYMAIRSRRFIPIAAYAACPILALVIQEALGRLLFTAATRRGSRLDPAAMAQATLEVSMIGIAAAMAVFGLLYLTLQRWMLIPLAPPNYDRFQPNLGLVLLWVLLPVLAFSCSIALYSIMKWPKPTQAGTTSWRFPDRLREFLAKFTVPAAWTLLCGYVIGVGTFVGWKFYDVYLGYWPADPVLTSVFMRMTASDAKPFDTCQFIRDNKFSGNMFNYWTEGGFIAWGQTPDPSTGRTPLQLFMDGRAQAAYDRGVFDRWTDIISGGPIVTNAARAGRALNANEYPQIAQWIAGELRKDNVWAVLMPFGQFDTTFVMALDVGQDWRVVFLNNKQKFFVDIGTEKGRKVYEDMLAGKLVYPDEFSADVTLGHNLLFLSGPDMKERRKRGFDLLLKAFELDHSPAPLIELLKAAYDAELRPQVDQACLGFATDFHDNRAKYAGHDGYNLRIEAARLCLVHLEQVAKMQGNAEAAGGYASRMSQYAMERNHISDTKRW